MVLPGGKASRRHDWGLRDQRTVLLLGPLDPAAAAAATAQVMTLDADGDDDIILHMACGEGDVLAALTLADVIHLANARVIAVAKGMTGGVAVAPFAAADRRVASPRASFHLKEPRLTLAGTALELANGADEARRQIDQFQSWIAGATGRPRQAIADDLHRGRLLDADAAVDYGLVHEILADPRSHDDAEKAP